MQNPRLKILFLLYAVKYMHIKMYSICPYYAKICGEDFLILNPHETLYKHDAYICTSIVSREEFLRLIIRVSFSFLFFTSSLPEHNL